MSHTEQVGPIHLPSLLLWEMPGRRASLRDLRERVGQALHGSLSRPEEGHDCPAGVQRAPLSEMPHELRLQAEPDTRHPVTTLLPELPPGLNWQAGIRPVRPGSAQFELTLRLQDDTGRVLGEGAMRYRLPRGGSWARPVVTSLSAWGPEASTLAGGCAVRQQLGEAFEWLGADQLALC